MLIRNSRDVAHNEAKGAVHEKAPTAGVHKGYLGESIK